MVFSGSGVSFSALGCMFHVYIDRGKVSVGVGSKLMKSF